MLKSFVRGDLQMEFKKAKVDEEHIYNGTITESELPGFFTITGDKDEEEWMTEWAKCHYEPFSIHLACDEPEKLPSDWPWDEEIVKPNWLMRLLGAKDRVRRSPQEYRIVTRPYSITVCSTKIKVLE